jgi:DNA-binding CsgD family transcriptional regulator
MQLQKYLDISQAKDLESLHRSLLAATQELGFGLFNAFLVLENPKGKRGPILESVDNTPPAYYSCSRDPVLVSRDPMIRRLKRYSVPQFYDQQLYVAEDAGDIWEVQAAYGYKCGICVALHLPEHRHFVFGMDRDASLPTSEKKLAHLTANVQLAAVHAEAAAHRLLLPLLEPALARSKAIPPILSSRELESLKWTMEGKTAWEVGMILGISQRSVAFHLGNAMRKLNSISKHQAVLRALQLGLM